MQVLPVIGGIDDQCIGQLGALQQPVEKGTDAPFERVAIGIAVAPPVRLRTAEAGARSGIGHIEEAAARQDRPVAGMAVGKLVVDREMRPDLVDQNEGCSAVAQQVRDPVGNGHVAVAHRQPAELNEAVDALAFARRHLVLHRAAGTLGIDIDRLQPGMRGIVPQRGPDRDVAAVAVPRPGKTQHEIGTGAAVGRRSGHSEIGDLDPGPRLRKARTHPARMVDIEIVARDAFIDDQHDIAVQRRPDMCDRDALARPEIACRSLIHRQDGVAERGIAAR